MAQLAPLQGWLACGTVRWPCTLGLQCCTKEKATVSPPEKDAIPMWWVYVGFCYPLKYRKKIWRSWQTCLDPWQKAQPLAGCSPKSTHILKYPHVMGLDWFLLPIGISKKDVEVMANMSRPLAKDPALSWMLPKSTHIPKYHKISPCYGSRLVFATHWDIEKRFGGHGKHV